MRSSDRDKLLIIFMQLSATLQMDQCQQPMHIRQRLGKIPVPQ